MKNNLNNKIIYIIIILLFIIILYFHRLELASFVYILLNMIINNLESLNNYLKDYLFTDISIEDNSPIEISDSNKLIDNTDVVNTKTPTEYTPLYKSKTFWLISGVFLIVLAAHIYKTSLGYPFLPFETDLHPDVSRIMASYKEDLQQIEDAILSNHHANTTFVEIYKQWLLNR
jgi:hypothetical protein